MKDAGEQLKEINQTPEENRYVKLSVPNREMEGLLLDINSSLQIIRREKVAYAKREKEFKQQIENISHDLRTPLTAILGYLRIMDRSGFDTEMQNNLDTVIRKAERLQELITQFYDFSRLAASEYTIEPEAVELTRLLREVLLDAYAELAGKQIEVTIQMPETEVTVTANENALQRVFQNLLQNVLRYAKSSLEVSVEERTGEVLISFINDVENMDEQDAGHLFERFFTLEQSRTGGSTGLGLTIAKELVEKMGGSIEARLEGGRLCISMRFAVLF